MACVLVPTIQISPAPPQEPLSEPFSPFNSLSFPDPDTDTVRPTHLSPVPTLSKPLSPLCPPGAPAIGRGLERERFEALLRASKERNALVGSKKAVDLRKEIALKAHRNKQVERRALFLSKILAPPSPTATSTPKTPPDSPAIFHYSLPSPGLVSPLALFDSLHENNECTRYTSHPWVEQVDFRLANDLKNRSIRSASLPQKKKATQVLPSLDQISARLKTLASGRSATTANVLPPPAIVSSQARPATIEIGRLKMPLRPSKLAPTSPSIPEPPSIQLSQPHIAMLPPKSPGSQFPSDLHVTTTLVPRTATASPVQLTESNLKILNSREHRAHNMLSTLRRRTLSTPQQAQIYPQTAPVTNAAMPGSLTRNAARRTTPLPLPLEVMELGLDDRKLKWKRHSAPADLMPRERAGFGNPVLSIPGAF